MELEERTSKTELILMNTRNFRNKIFNLKKMMKKNNNFNINHKNKNKINNNKLFDKTKYYYRNQNKENKYKIMGTQTTKSTYENNKLNLKLSPSYKIKKNKKIIFNEIKTLCDNIYDSNSHQDNGFKIKIREDIVRSIDNYIFSDLKKNILFPRTTNIRNRKIQHFTFLKKKEKNKEKKELDKKFCDSNRVSMKDIFKNESKNNKDNDNDNDNDNETIDVEKSNRKIKVYKYKFEDYAISDVKYNHSIKYTLNNAIRRQNLFPIINPPKTIYSFRDFTDLIPEKRINKKELNKQIYKAYKTMKIKNKKEIGILI